MQNKAKGSVKRTKVVTGVVTSDAMDKTIAVRVTRLSKHPMYKKVVKKYNNCKTHDEKNIAKVGDMVKIVETRPLSKTKRWRLIERIER